MIFQFSWDKTVLFVDWITILIFISFHFMLLFILLCFRYWIHFDMSFTSSPRFCFYLEKPSIAEMSIAFDNLLWEKRERKRECVSKMNWWKFPLKCEQTFQTHTRSHLKSFKCMYAMPYTDDCIQILTYRFILIN